MLKDISVNFSNSGFEKRCLSYHYLVCDWSIKNFHWSFLIDWMTWLMINADNWDNTISVTPVLSRVSVGVRFGFKLKTKGLVMNVDGAANKDK